MRVHVQKNTFAERLAKQLLDTGNEKMAINESTQCIVSLPTNLCKITKIY